MYFPPSGLGVLCRALLGDGLDFFCLEDVIHCLDANISIEFASLSCFQQCAITPVGFLNSHSFSGVTCDTTSWYVQKPESIRLAKCDADFLITVLVCKSSRFFHFFNLLRHRLRFVSSVSIPAIMPVGVWYFSFGQDSARVPRNTWGEREKER